MPAKRQMVLPACRVEQKGASRRRRRAMCETPRQSLEQLTRAAIDKVKFDCRTKAVLEDSRCNCMIGMRTQPGVTHIAHHLVRSQILCQRTGAVEVSLHASVERLEPALQHIDLIGRQVERNRTAASQQSVCAFGGGIHAMALKLRARHRRRHKLARAPPAHTRSRASSDSTAPKRSGSHPKTLATVLSTTRSARASRAARPRARRSGTRRPNPPMELTNHHRCGPAASNEASKPADAAANASAHGPPTSTTSRPSKPRANASAKSSANATRRSPGRTIPSRDSAAGMRGRKQPRLTCAGPCSPGLF